MNLKEKAEGIVTTNVLWSMGAGLIPIPFLDSAAVLGIQLDLVKQLARNYGIDASETTFRSIIATLTAGYATRMGVDYAARLIKFIPVIGTFAGGVAMAVLSGASTYAVGQVFIKHFDTGGDMFSFNADSFKTFYEEQFEKGKKYAQDLRQEFEKKQETKTTENPEDAKTDKATNEQSFDQMSQKLNQLKEMYDKGLINEAEFKELKEKILNKSY